MTLMEKIVAGLLIGFSIVLVTVFAFVAVTEDPTPLVAAAFQFVSFASGLAGSYLFGRQGVPCLGSGAFEATPAILVSPPRFPEL